MERMRVYRKEEGGGKTMGRERQGRRGNGGESNASRHLSN